MSQIFHLAARSKLYKKSESLVISPKVSWSTISWSTVSRSTVSWANVGRPIDHVASWTWGGLYTTEEAFLIPTQQPQVWIPAPPRFILFCSLYRLVCEQYCN